MVTDRNLFVQLQLELTNLPGESAHLEMFPLRKVTSEALKASVGHRISAVLALIYVDTSSYQIILIERQDYDGNHSGQIGFPGGKKEMSDASELAAALRETFEEIGIPENKITILGKLTDVYIPVSNFLVHPFVGYLKKIPKYLIDAREVKSVLQFDLKELLNEKNKIVTNVKIGNGNTLKNVPAFIANEKIIWGATALMLNELKIILKRLNF